MVKSKILRFLLLIWSLVLILFVFKSHISETVWQTSLDEIKAKKFHYSKEIDSKEVDTFIRLWPEYHQIKASSELDKISYKTLQPSKLADWKTKMWFVYHHIDIDRFFYIQQRIISLLRTIEVRNRAEALIEKLSSSKKKVAVEMVELQQKILKDEKIDDIEYLIITSRKEKLKKILKEYP